MKPIVFYDNLMLSGTLSGTAAATDNPVRLVADGSINVQYTLTATVAPLTQSGSVYVELAEELLPTSLILPRCSIPSGMTLTLRSMDDVDGTGSTDVLSETFTELTTFYKVDLPATSAQEVWQLEVSGVSGVGVPAEVYEIQLAPNRVQFDRSPQVSVRRTRVRQFDRLGIPGGQPFVRRNGPRLRRTDMTLILVSGAETDEVRDFVDGVEGGSAFTLQDDLGECYWAELLGMEVAELDDAGVSTWDLSFQEIRVDG